MKILAIDTSCDETSVAVLNGRVLLSNIVASQTELHKKWGGVVPMVARRAHEENLPKAINEALKRAKQKPSDIEYVAVTQGPGLAIDLEVGITEAKKFAIENGIPLIAVNHMEGHLLSSLILNSNGSGRYPFIDLEPLFPALGLLVSGKHTEIIYMKGIGDYEKIGQTLDDAAGEAFDKFGRMMGFGYPGGPIVASFAKKGDVGKIELPIPMQKSKDLNFSYSGLKTAALYRLEELRSSGKKDKELAANFCAQFEYSVVQSILLKLEKAIELYPDAKTLFTGGGVFHNESLSRRVGWLARREGLRYLLPEKRFRSDNAAMIGLVAFFKASRGEVLKGEKKLSQLDRVPRMGL